MNSHFSSSNGSGTEGDPSFFQLTGHMGLWGPKGSQFGAALVPHGLDRASLPPERTGLQRRPLTADVVPTLPGSSQRENRAAHKGNIGQPTKGK